MSDDLSEPKSLAVSFGPPKMKCPKGHEFVSGLSFYVHAEMRAGPFCPECYIEWVSANVPAGVPVAQEGASK